MRISPQYFIPTEAMLCGRLSVMCWVLRDEQGSCTCFQGRVYYQGGEADFTHPEVQIFNDKLC